jgi:hypothetical protein
MSKIVPASAVRTICHYCASFDIGHDIDIVLAGFENRLAPLALCQGSEDQSDLDFN